ncbi:MAG: nucleoside triphosphate pyrophosphohydrolase [Armatimonadota bacterium]|nr:nucleoside triphosphate pyrophosphohydrolase [bacterium]
MTQDRIRDEWTKLVETVEKLRGPDGCPWDRQQTHESLKKYAIEETYEVVEAIECGDPDKIEDELGDMLLQVLLHAQIANEAGQFDVANVCKRIREKLWRRHPHVFADTEVSGVDDVLHNWEQIKRAEPGYEDRKSVLDGVPQSMPALMRAAKMSKKAARTGFDWPDVHAVFGKLDEETHELKEAIAGGDKSRIMDELGDVLFTVVNIARYEEIDPEEALRAMLDKFRARFSRIEDHARQTGRSIQDMSLDEMDGIWNEAKEI